MKKEIKMNFHLAILMLALFLLWTVMVRFVDLQAIGPLNSSVGFATLNGMVHNLTGVNMSFYTITDWLGLVPIIIAMGFCFLGLFQWIKRKNVLKVDKSILFLGGFYIVVMAIFIFFEKVVINYRPVLINGFLEASYPSSTTLLVMCVVPTAIMQFNLRIKNIILKRFVGYLLAAFIVFMVVGRLISGVHWITDIIGGGLLSAGLVLLYRAFLRLKVK